MTGRAIHRLRSLKGERGQALPVAIGALALGAILITPLLLGASGGSQATGSVGRAAVERYSLDAGIEWSGWRLISNPTITAVTTYTSAPLAPFPSAVNGQPFPTTEIRHVPGAGAVESQAPAWQTGGGDRCYTVVATDAGTLSMRVAVDAGTVSADLLADGDPCVLPAGATPLGTAPSVGQDFAIGSAGTYQVVVRTDTATTGSIALSVPAASYDVRSTNGARSTEARIVAGASGVRVESWQLN
jgi:hypothetical protein